LGPGKAPGAVHRCGKSSCFLGVFAGRGLAKLVEPPRASDLAPERERPFELDSDLTPRLRAPVRVQHHAQEAVDAEPGVPEASVGVVHFAFSPQTVAPICSPDLHKNLSPR